MGTSSSITAPEWHEIGAITMAIIGVILVGISSNTFKHMKITCHQKSVRQGAMWIMILGTILICVSGMYAFCLMTGGTCGIGSMATEVAVAYKGLAGVLSVVIFILSIIILSKLSKLKKSQNPDSNNQYNVCGGSNVMGGMVVLTILSGLAILIMAGIEGRDFFMKDDDEE